MAAPRRVSRESGGEANQSTSSEEQPGPVEEPAEAHRQHPQRVFVGSLQTSTYLELKQTWEGN